MKRSSLIGKVCTNGSIDPICFSLIVRKISTLRTTSPSPFPLRVLGKLFDSHAGTVYGSRVNVVDAQSKLRCVQIKGDGAAKASALKRGY